MNKPKKIIENLKKLHVMAKSMGVNIDVAALYAKNVAGGLEALVEQAFSAYTTKDHPIVVLGRVWRRETDAYCVVSPNLNCRLGEGFEFSYDICSLACRYIIYPDFFSWPWAWIDDDVNERIGRAKCVLIWLRFIRAARECPEMKEDGEWLKRLLTDMDDVCNMAYDAIEHEIQRKLPIRSLVYGAGVTHPAAPGAGFTAKDRRRLNMSLNRIERAAVFGDTLTPAQMAGHVRRKQAKYGARLYSPSSKYKQGVSFREAAKKTIDASEFKDVEGAYSIQQIKALAQAIRREYNKPMPDSAT